MPDVDPDQLLRTEKKPLSARVTAGELTPTVSGDVTFAAAIAMRIKSCDGLAGLTPGQLPVYWQSIESGDVPGQLIARELDHGRSHRRVASEGTQKGTQSQRQVPHVDDTRQT